VGLHGEQGPVQQEQLHELPQLHGQGQPEKEEGVNMPRAKAREVQAFFELRRTFDNVDVPLSEAVEEFETEVE